MPEPESVPVSVEEASRGYIRSVSGSSMTRERPQIVVVRQGGDHGCLITILLLIVAWPLAIVYWLVRLVVWLVGSAVDWLTLGPIRRGRR
jgi:hypothetical protein